MTTTYQDIERSFLFKKTVRNYLGQESIETIVRSTSFIVRLKQESSRNIRRIILLSPGGFTADSVDLLSPHPEAREARIKIMGKINPTKKGFKPLLNEIRLDYSYSRKVPISGRILRACLNRKRLNYKNILCKLKNQGIRFLKIKKLSQMS